MERPEWVPEGIPLDVPNAARMYDYALGGYHNFEVDRKLVEQAEAAMPGAAKVAYANRDFLGRAVRWLVAAGVRQFLDIGSGIPTLANVHEVAQAAAADARVVYVDIDPVAVAHSRAILAGTAGVGVIQGDARRPGQILADPEVTGLLDLTRPVAVLLVAVLHFVADEDDPAGVVSRLMQALPPGSYLVLSHGTRPPARLRDADTVDKLYRRTSTPLHLRSEGEVAALVRGLTLVGPGIVPVSDWLPESAHADHRPEVVAVVGVKP